MNVASRNDWVLLLTTMDSLLTGYDMLNKWKSCLGFTYYHPFQNGCTHPWRRWRRRTEDCLCYLVEGHPGRNTWSVVATTRWSTTVLCISMFFAFVAISIHLTRLKILKQKSPHMLSKIKKKWKYLNATGKICLLGLWIDHNVYWFLCIR